MNQRKMPSILVYIALLASITGCDGPFHTPTHAEALASGSSIQVTSFNLVWGHEHDEHTLGQDCFALEYVTAIPDADASRRDAEAAEAFELVRAVSEQWGFREATVAAIPTLAHKGPYDLYWYRRAPDGHWWSTVVFRDGKWIANALSASPQ